MINCFVRALRRRRPSIREDLEAITEDKDVQVTVQVGGDSHERPGFIICKPKSAFGQSGNETQKLQIVIVSLQILAVTATKRQKLPSSNYNLAGVAGSSRSIA